MMDAWRELLGAALAVWDGLVAGTSVAWSNNVVEAVLTFRLTPAIENALIAWSVVCGAGSFVAAAFGAWWKGRG